MDGSFTDWAGVEAEYRDTVGDTVHRDYNGYGELHYTNTLGRNDIITSKVAVAQDNVYFQVETQDALTPHTGTNWLLLLIDADQNTDTGWFGYDYIINLRVVDDKTTTLQRYAPGVPGGPWVEVSRLEYRYAGKRLELAVPRQLLAWKGDAFSFDFKWCDNPPDLKDPISLCLAGDTAPNRRFNYRCIWKKEGAGR